MIKAEEAVKKSLVVRQSQFEKEFEALLSDVENAIEVEIVGGGELMVELDVTDNDSEAVALVAEHVRKYGWKTALHTKEITKTMSDEKGSVTVPIGTESFLRVSAAHFKDKIKVDRDDSVRGGQTKQKEQTT